ncbi:MAG: hypothetical protein ACRYG4_02915 [Janthinobacterium lividum]
MNKRPISGNGEATLDDHIWVFAAAKLTVGKRPSCGHLAGFSTSLKAAIADVRHNFRLIDPSS